MRRISAEEMDRIIAEVFARVMAKHDRERNNG